MLASRYQAVPRGAASIRRWTVILASGAALTGVLWGCAATVALVTSSYDLQVFSVMIIGGMLAAGVMANAAYLPAMLAFGLPATVPAILIFLGGGDFVHAGTGLLLLLFTGSIMLSATNLNRVIAENIRMRLGHDALLAKLRSSEAGMAEAQSIAKLGSWELDLVSNLVILSPEAYRIFGVDPGDFKPSYDTMMGCVHPDDQVIVARSFAEAKTKGLASAIDHRLVTADGTLRFIHETPKAIFGSDGRAMRISGTVQDVTDQRLLENRLKLANLVLTTQMEAAPDGIMVVDGNRHVTAFNQRVAEIWQIPTASLVTGDDDALRARMFSQVKDPQSYRMRISHLAETPDEAGGGEVALVDGKFLRYFTRAMRGPSGENLGRVWFFTDVSESRQAADALAYRDHLLHTVTAAMAVAVGALSLADGVNAALVKIGESMGVDRVTVMQSMPDDSPPLASRFMWEAASVTVPFDLGAAAHKYDRAEMAAWRHPLWDGVPVLADVVTAKGAVRDMMMDFQIQSALLMPVFVGGAAWGVLGIDMCHAPRRWAASEIETMRILADVAGALIVRERARVALETSEQRFRLLTMTATDGVITTDKSGRILQWNPGAERIFGYGAAEALGQQVGPLLTAGERQRAGGPVLGAENTLPGSTLELEATRKDGTAVTIEISVSRAQLGNEWEVILISRDISKRKTAERKLLFANILLKTQMEASPDGILVVDDKRQVLSYNQRFAGMWHVPTAFLEAGNDDAVLAHVTAAVKNPDEFLRRVKHLLGHPAEEGVDEVETLDGRLIERHSASLQLEATDNLGRVWFFRDVTARRATDALALRLAHYDVLTGLANRAVFVDAIQQGIALSKRNARSLAVLYLDLDHFKDVNDTLGHPVGDALLKAVAARLLAHTRATDTVARFGGDEFAILASEIGSPEDAGLLANKLVAAIGEPFVVAGNNIHTDASIGIDLYSSKAPDAETLLSHADVALYRAKAEGGGAYLFFTDAMDKQVRKRFNMSTQLRAALAAGELFLLYQPQVDAATGQITGLEALVRWHHPTRGELGPAAFIPVAETTGMIGLIGHFVLWTACRQAKKWLNIGIDFKRISVNVSALQFKTPLALEADITSALADTGLPPQFLELELTESVLMDASREHSSILLRLRAIGVKLAIDDFGTGYSSLDYLRRFPADHIKIAQSFTKNIETELGDASIVRAIIGLSRELNISVIAEGIETQAQLELVKGWGCQNIQGFYFARPLSAEKITALLSHGSIIQPEATRPKEA
jgi:diguanylate cyclase (GGDEF)-like protein/PAS domain S-box-containing protein